MKADLSPIRPAPISEAARKARTPRPPAELIGAHSDRVHIDRAKLIAAVPLKPKRVS